MIQESQKQQRRKFYRSIPYRSVSIDINPQKLSSNKQRLPAFQINKPHTSKNEYRQNKRNSFHSQQKIKSFNKALSQSLYKSKQANLNSTMISTGNPEIQTFTNFANCSYIESFQQLMQTQTKKPYEPKKLGPISLRIQSRKSINIPDRIILPNIVEYQNSQFTALDPINLPINAIKQEIQRTKKSMQQCPNQLQFIRWEIKEFKEKSIMNIGKFQYQFKKGIQKLWGLLRENNVHQQTFSLRAKREIKQIQNFIPSFKSEFQKSHLNQLNLQTTIFQTSPFQLKKYQNQNQDSNLKSRNFIKMQNDYF